MWFVFAPAADPSAAWALRGLRARGLSPLEFVSSELLLRSRRWVHRVGDGGDTVEVELADGRTIRSEDVRGLLNRITYIAPDQLLPPSDDRDYVIQELHAFFISWLNALPGHVLGRPTPQGLCGRWRQLSEWTLLAETAGLPTPGYRQSSLDADGFARFSLAPADAALQTVFVVNGAATGADAPTELLEGCARLAALAGGELLGVEFTVDEHGRWCFARASPVPDLESGGEPLLDLLEAALRGKTRSYA